jgi:hypothetical protein
MRSAIVSFVGTALLFAGIAGCSSNNGAVATNTPTNPGLQSTTQYTQIERLARPAVKELFENFQNHDTSNRTSPFNDPTLSSSITSFTSNFRAAQYGTTLATVLIPDVIKYDTSQSGNAAYLGVETGGATGSKVGGRDLTSPVIDISLGAVFGTTLSTLGLVTADGKDIPCLTTQNMPANKLTGQTQYSSLATITAAKKETATFPYLGTPY